MLLHLYFLQAALLSVVTNSASLRSSSLQPRDGKKDTYPVIFMGNYDYVDRKKFEHMVYEISQPVMKEDGLVTGKDFGSMVAYDRTVIKHSRAVVVPPQDYDNLENLALEVKEDFRSYVESGHVLIVSLSDPGGMNNPIEMLNDIFNMTLDGASVTAGADCVKEETVGFAFAFNKGPDAAPFQDNIWAVKRASLPEHAYKVYSEGDSIAVFIITYGSGLIIGIGNDFATAGSNIQWRTILRLAVDTGRFLDKIRLGNTVVYHQGSTFGKIEPHGNFTNHGKEELPEKGLECLAWRKTLNCDPSGPRDMKGDKNCTDIIPAEESGYCECEGYIQTAAATCSHRLISCRTECMKVARRYRDLYGSNYKAPSLHDMQRAIEGAYKDHHAKMMKASDEAITNTARMVKAMKQANDDYKDRLKKFGNPPMWKQIHDAGVEAVKAGQNIQGMASMANPFLDSSIWTFPHHAPQPPPPPFQAYQNVNPIFQDWLKEHAYEIQNTPAP